MPRIHLALTTVVLSTLACMSARPKIAVDAAPDPNVGYVGAIFAKDTVQHFGLTLQDEAGQHEYTLALDNGIGLVDLPPGRYHVTRWITAIPISGDIETEQAIPKDNALGRAFDLAGGQVVLLGKWRGAEEVLSRLQWTGNAFRTAASRYSIVPEAITLQEATAAVREVYPRFGEAPVSCWLCAD